MINRNKKDKQCVLIRIGGSVQNTLCRLRYQQRVWGYAPTSKYSKNSGTEILEYGVNGYPFALLATLRKW